MEEAWHRARATFWALFGAPAFWLTLFFVVPLAVIWAYSFGENSGPVDVDVTFTLKNYARAVEPLYLSIFAKSAWYAALTTLLCLGVGFPVALAISFAGPRAKLILLMLVMLPFWTNLLIRTYALMAVLRDEGYVNIALRAAWEGGSSLAQTFGFSSWSDFSPLPLLHNNFAVVFGLVYVQLPFMVLPLYAALDRLDRSLLEASLDLGAGHLTTLWRVVVPLALPGILSGIVITFIPTLGAFLTPDLLGGPDSQMISNVIERQFKRANDWPFGSALSFVLMYVTFFAIAAQSMLARKRQMP